MKTFLLLGALCLAPFSFSESVGQTSARPDHPRVLVPQARLRGGADNEVRVRAVTVDIDIVEQMELTVMEIEVHNPTGTRREAEMVVPVPVGAVLRGFDFKGSGERASAKLLPRDEARRVYDAIVARTKDPAILEFVGYHLVRSAVFPVEPTGRRRTRYSRRPHASFQKRRFASVRARLPSTSRSTASNNGRSPV